MPTKLLIFLQKADGFVVTFAQCKLCNAFGRFMHTKTRKYMTKNKGILTLVGFLLAGIGFMALILSLVGLQLAFLTWIDAPGRLFGFLMRLLMILAGIVIIYFAQTGLRNDE